MNEAANYFRKLKPNTTQWDQLNTWVWGYGGKDKTGKCIEA